jgi:GNAT superfamily N-acetyltransferase
LRWEIPAGIVELRFAVPADEPFLRELDGAIVAERLGAGGLDPETLTTLQELQFVARRRDRAVRYPAADEQLISLDGRPVGAVVVDRSRERVLLIDLSVFPTARGRGIATTIMVALAATADRSGVPLRATTQSTNVRARELYARAGFRELDDDGLNVSLERPSDQSSS